MAGEATALAGRTDVPSALRAETENKERKRE
jgi:hypothetical protein